MRPVLALLLLASGCMVKGGAVLTRDQARPTKPVPVPARQLATAQPGPVVVRSLDEDHDEVEGKGDQLRAGGLGLGRRFEPRVGLRLPLLERRLAGRSLGAEVRPFASEAAGAEQEPVDRAGELVALALALQLERLGWSVEVTGRELLAEGLRAPAATGSSPAARFRISGAVGFATTPSEARLRGTVRFERESSAVTASLEVVTAAPTGEAPSRRRVLAAEAALAAFVARLLAEPELDRKLAALLPAR